MEGTDELKIFDDKLINELSQIEDNIQYWDIKAGISTGTNLDFTDQKSKEISSFEVSVFYKWRMGIHSSQRNH